MKYKVQMLIVDKDGNVDIPEGWTPVGYKEVLIIPSSGTAGGSYVNKEVIVLEPMKTENLE